MSKHIRVLIPLGLFALLLVAGLLAVQSSSYKSVCSLRAVVERENVIVKGEVAPLPLGAIKVEVSSRSGTAVFEGEGLKGNYGIITYVEGTLPASLRSGRYAIFVLKGNCDFAVIALYDAAEFERIYGAGAAISTQEVVVQGDYMPDVTVVVYRDGRVLYKGPLLLVDKILKGCHEAYTQPMVS